VRKGDLEKKGPGEEGTWRLGEEETVRKVTWGKGDLGKMQKRDLES